MKMAALMSSSSFLLKSIYFALIDLALLSYSLATCSFKSACSARAAHPTFFGIPKDNLATPQDWGLAASTVIDGFWLLGVPFSVADNGTVSDISVASVIPCFRLLALLESRHIASRLSGQPADILYGRHYGMQPCITIFSTARSRHRRYRGADERCSQASPKHSSFDLRVCGHNLQVCPLPRNWQIQACDR